MKITKQMKLLGLICLITTGCFCMSANAQQMQRKLTGQVTDNSGEKLVGVSVLEVGTSNGVITDLKGNYSINVKTFTPQLKFSYIGYKDVIINITENKNVFNVLLNQSSELLDDIVVIGYGTSSKRNVTGAISKVNMAFTENLPNTSVTQSLRGGRRWPGTMHRTDAATLFTYHCCSVCCCCCCCIRWTTWFNTRSAESAADATGVTWPSETITRVWKFFFKASTHSPSCRLASAELTWLCSNLQWLQGAAESQSVHPLL